MYYHDNVRRTFISGHEMHMHFPKIDPVDKIRLVIQEFLPRLAFGSYACFTSWV